MTSFDAHGVLNILLEDWYDIRFERGQTYTSIEAMSLNVLLKGGSRSCEPSFRIIFFQILATIYRFFVHICTTFYYYLLWTNILLKLLCLHFRYLLFIKLLFITIHY